jgi:DNA-binding transcriptional LysR family regulator
MTLRQLKYFIETANLGSINKAAEALYIAQPSL